MFIGTYTGIAKRVALRGSLKSHCVVAFFTRQYAPRGFIRRMAESKVEAIFCGLMTNETLGLMLNMTETKIHEYMDEMSSWHVDSLFLESEVSLPDNVSIINFQEDEQAGKLMVIALQNLNSIYAARNPDPTATTADGMDYGFNTILRETILKDQTFFNITTEYPLIDETTPLVDVNVTLTDLRFYGLDTAAVLTPFTVIGNTSIQTRLRWDNLTMEFDMITRATASKHPSSFLENGDKREPIFESVTLIGGVHTIDLTVSIFVPLDRSEVNDLPMGYILDWASLEPCIPPVLSNMVFSGLEVTLGGFHDAKLEGIASQAIDQLSQQGIQFGLAMYEEKIMALVPYLFQTRIRDTLNNFQSRFHCPVNGSVSRNLESRNLEKEEFERVEGEALYVNVICSIVCVFIAALAAGLTMGLLSLDEMLLLIKERAGATERERKAAASLLPIVRQHHLLLVSLLLMNALANEALPLFLDKVFGGISAVVISVVLVLFFGEIIPAAVFTGPDQIKLASRMAPIVRVVMFVLSPIAWPIAKLLDCTLHHEGDNGYSRGELTALVRIQYEEHLANKMSRKSQYRDVLKQCDSRDTESAVGFASERSGASGQMSVRSGLHPELRSSIRAIKGQISRARNHEIHVDEVAMVEGALKMRTTEASEVYTPWNQVFALPSDMILNERNAVKIYRSGFSRIPIYVRDKEDPKDNTNIIGILAARQLMVIDSQDQREVSTLPLAAPRCVSPHTSLVDLINMFQSGGIQGGHMALVCTRPEKASEALREGRSLPEEAGLIG
jgi:metal transporter CNNM